MEKLNHVSETHNPLEEGIKKKRDTKKKAFLSKSALIPNILLIPKKTKAMYPIGHVALLSSSDMMRYHL